ncbi:hypothetical protein PPYR_12511 [Photinus pyralis]|uniref:Uncharacterized protein n=1 Tax=Photinus pyralis TaxID=7054 RepID=A0A1Y1N7M9_PHOPY|nr:uncharacterized protein LOC116177883 isoform X2 [Photinus pyralis]KAB0792891.1 hypothetical protein PPYR_12511 [Photinus pyralis]
MMYENSVLFILFSVLLSCILNADALKCFQCNTYENPACLDVTAEDVNSPLLKECEQIPGGPEPFCRKNRYSLFSYDGSVRVQRGCGWMVFRENVSLCYDADTDFKDERNCQCFTDGCNVASTPLAVFYHVLVGILVVMGTARAIFTN